MKYMLCIIYVLEQFTYYCILKVFSMLYTCVFILYNGSKILVYQMYSPHSEILTTVYSIV